jgi:TRAP-type transport system small permease protein
MEPDGARRPAILVPLGHLNDALLLACKWTAIALIAVIAVIVIASVIFRYGLNDSIAWAEDAAKFLMVWMAFVGAPLGFRHGAHVAIELLPADLPPLLKRTIRLLVHAVVLMLMAVLAWQSWLFAWNGWGQIALTIGDISMFWIFLAIPIGSAIMALIALDLLLGALLGLPEPQIAEDETISTQGL